MGACHGGLVWQILPNNLDPWKAISSALVAIWSRWTWSGAIPQGQAWLRAEKGTACHAETGVPVRLARAHRGASPAYKGLSPLVEGGEVPPPAAAFSSRRPHVSFAPTWGDIKDFGSFSPHPSLRTRGTCPHPTPAIWLICVSAKCQPGCLLCAGCVRNIFLGSCKERGSQSRLSPHSSTASPTKGLSSTPGL